MARPRDVDYLQPDERPRLRARRHPLSAVDAFIALALVWALATAGVAVLLFGIVWQPGSAIAALVAITLTSIIGAVLIHWRRATSLYVITDQRAYKAYGRVRFHLVQTTYDKVTDLHLHQSIFGRLWDYGTVRLQTAGTGLALVGVRDPVGLKKEIETQRRGFLDALIGASRTRQVSDPRPSATPSALEERTLWEGGPTGASLMVPTVFGIIALVVAVTVGVFAVAFEPAALLGALFPALIGAFALLGAWVQFRYTKYAVGTTGVVVTRGWLSRRRVEATYSKVTDVSVDQDILARIFGYGKITINTAGSNEAPIVFAGIARHDMVKQIIDEARRRSP